MQVSQVPDYLSFDNTRGRKEGRCKVYFYEKNIYYLLIQFFKKNFHWVILFLFLFTPEISFLSILRVFLEREVRRMVNFLYIQNQNIHLT